MGPGHFGIYGAGEKLEAKLQGYQADCMSTVWSHINVPLERRHIDGKEHFLIRWKPVWTPEADITDLNQARISCQQQKNGRRTSSRIRKFDEEKWASYMRVAVLESYLNEETEGNV